MKKSNLEYILVSGKCKIGSEKKLADSSGSKVQCMCTSWFWSGSYKSVYEPVEQIEERNQPTNH